MKKKFVDQNAAIDFCTREGELLVISKEVDPVFEIAGITKSFEGGPALIFEKIKGYPKWRAVTNLLSRRDRVARYFGTTKEGLPERVLKALKNPISARLVNRAPCQDHVITEPIDILKTLPVIKSTKMDIGPVISGGVVMVNVPQEMGGGRQSFNLSFHRFNAGLGRDWMSLRLLYHRHLLEVLRYQQARKEECPVTLNIGLSPALNLLGGGSFRQIQPVNGDDLGVAGNLQGEAVEICKARTVEAYALAQAEVVLEGKVMVEDEISESSGSKYSEESNRSEDVYFFPEATGYEALAGNAFKFQVTGITYRKHPVYYTPLGDSHECLNLGTVISEANIFHACKASAPHNFLNCHIPDAMRGALGVVIQCRVTHAMQQGISQDLISAAFSAVRGLRWVIVVDEDVDIYDPSDILWALSVRTQADEDINVIKGTAAGNRFSTKWSIDTTVPISEKSRALRPQFEKMDLSRWLKDEEVSKGFSLMSEGAKSIARRRV